MKKYIVEVLDGMAKGLFSSLIAGLIIIQLGKLLGIEQVLVFGKFAQYMMGPAIGVGIALKRNAGMYTIIAAAIVGALGAGTFNIEANTLRIGEPVGALISVLFAVEAGKLLEGKTSFDLLIIPIIVASVGGVVALFIAPPISSFMTSAGDLINKITMMQPVLMGILLGLIVGALLTLPISSAALCIAIGINGLAAGAALAGCCAQMIGFAVISYRENRISGFFLQGLGTSMIQIGNIVKNFWVWIPTLVASAVGGLLATTVFKLPSTSLGAGMGTAGLVGPIATLELVGMGRLFEMFLLYLIIPALLSLIVYMPLLKLGYIKRGDLKL
ncbi:MAG: PTS transporter subunit IIC [Bacteroidales bacterium]